MLKIERNLSRRSTPEYIRNHLYTDSSTVRMMINALTFFILDIFCLLPIIGNTFVKSHFIIVIIPTIIVNIWAVAINFRSVYSTQIESLICLTVVCTTGLLTCFMITYEMVFLEVGVESSIYLYLLIVYFLAWIFYFIRYYMKRFSTIDRKKDIPKEGYVRWLGLFLLLFPGNGHYFYQTYIKNSAYLNHFGPLLYLVLSIAFIYLGVKTIHKLAFMRANWDKVGFMTPTRKELKRANAEGKNIKIR